MGSDISSSRKGLQLVDQVVRNSVGTDTTASVN